MVKLIIITILQYAADWTEVISEHTVGIHGLGFTVPFHKAIVAVGLAA